MSQLLYFKLQACPFCKQADRLLEKAIQKNPEYAKIPIKVIEENKQKELADSYDYYYVPTFFYNDIKLHEGIATYRKIKKVLSETLKQMKKEGLSK